MANRIKNGANEKEVKLIPKNVAKIDNEQLIKTIFLPFSLSSDPWETPIVEIRKKQTIEIYSKSKLKLIKAKTTLSVKKI